MAIGIRTDTPVTTGTGSTTYVINKPSDAVQGDQLFVAVGCHETGRTISIDGSMTQVWNFDGPGEMLAVFRKTVGAGEGASYTVSVNSTTACLAIAALAVDADGAMTVHGEASGTDAGGAVLSTSSITTDVDNELVLSFFSQDQSTGGNFSATTPAGLAAVIQAWDTSNQQGIGVFKEARATAGSGINEVTQTLGDPVRGGTYGILAVKETLTSAVMAWIGAAG